jgi:hypothetical protein
MRDAIAAMTGGDTKAGRLEPVTIEAGGKRVAAYRGVVESYGARNRIVMVFLDDGRLFHATGRRTPSTSVRSSGRWRRSSPRIRPTTSSTSTRRPTRSRRRATIPAAFAASPATSAVHDQRGGGSTPLDVALDQSGRDATREEVVVGATPKPIVLVLNRKTIRSRGTSGGRRTRASRACSRRACIARS